MKRIHTLDIIIKLVQPMQKIPDAGTLIIFPVKATVLPQKADALEYFHKIITHFFLLKDILENIAAVLCHRRICIQTRHHVLDVVLFPLLC